MKYTAVCGGFDPFHEGHLDHLIKAYTLGNNLRVFVNPDRDLVKKKGYCFEPLWFRKQIVRAVMKLYGLSGTVEDVEDRDGTCAKTLKKWKPDIFAKGGDRTEQNMPQNELDTCREIGCRIVYGAGDKLNSSSNIRRNLNVNGNFWKSNQESQGRNSLPDNNRCPPCSRESLPRSNVILFFSVEDGFST